MAKDIVIAIAGDTYPEIENVIGFMSGYIAREAKMKKHRSIEAIKIDNISTGMFNMRFSDSEIITSNINRAFGIINCTAIISNIRDDIVAESLILYAAGNLNKKFVSIKIVAKSIKNEISDNNFDYILNIDTYKGEDMKHMIKQILVKEGII